MPHLLLKSDARRIPLRDASMHCVVTSPPYYNLRDYGSENQIGLEETPDLFIAEMVKVFREVWRVLRDDGVVWLNIADSYCNAGSRNNGTGLNGERRGGMGDTDGSWESSKATYKDIRHSLKAQGIKHKDRMGIPHRLVFALQDAGWYWRDEIVWFKRNPMPESVTDRTTKAHEMVFLLAKNERYFYDAEAIKEPATCRGSGNKEKFKSQEEIIERVSGIPWDGSDDRNARSVWDIDEEEYAQFLRWKAEHPNKDNRSSVFDIPTVSWKGAHFATMPPKLAERCILAGTSEKGCCAECGTPWERILEKHATGRVRNRAKGGLGKEQSRESHGLGAVEGQFQEGVQYRTVGWRQSCSRPSHAVRPCLVLDPFNGSGTTGSVATGLNRDYVGLDISDDYLTMARRRIERPHVAPVRIKAESMPLFGE